MKTLYIITLILFSFSIMAQKARIEGRVYDATNNEPLPFSNIVIRGTQTGASSDFDGKYIITQVDPGFYMLEVRSLGYETFVTPEFQVIPGKTVTIDVPLQKNALLLGEIKVEAPVFVRKDESPVSLRTISISQIENSAGANRDISKVIQTFPGVAAFPAANRNDIIVRGGGSNESRFYLDGVEIPNINHFATQGASGGTNGILNADFMREANFYSSAFPAMYGNATSAVFDFKQIDGNPDRMRFRGTLGASETALTVDGPLSENHTMIFSLRRSYLQFLFKVIGLPFLPTYNDYQYKSRIRLDAKNEIKIISVGAYDVNRLDTDLKNPTEFQQYLLNYIPGSEQWNYAIGGVYTHYRQNGYSNLVLSRNMFTNSSSKYLNNNDSDASALLLKYSSSEIENKFRYETMQQLTKGKIDYGIDGGQVKYTNSTFQKIYTGDSLRTVDFSSDMIFYRYGIFAQYTRRYYENRLSLSGGIRMDGNTYNNEMANPLNQFSPRAAVTYQLTEKTALIASGGRYYQLPGLTALGFRDKAGTLVNKNNGIRYLRSDHVVAGVEHFPKKDLKLTVEGFYKWYANSLVSLYDTVNLAHRPIDFGSIGNEPVSSDGKGHAYGFEILAQYRMSASSNLVVAYTYAISEYEDKNGEMVSSSWDNRHILNITANRKFGSSWTAAVKWRFAGGLPYTTYDLETSSLIQAWNVQNQPYFDYSQLNSNRLKPFHQLDIRVDKSFFFKKSSLKIYLDIQNLYNFKSDETDRVTNLDENGKPVFDLSDPSRYQLRTIKSDGNGLILPTIGIIFDF